MAEISQGMEADMKSSGFIALAIIAAIFWLCYRRIRPLLALVGMLVITFILSLAAAGLFLADLTVMGVGFAAIMIGLSVDYGYLIYQQWVEHGGSAQDLRKRCLPNIFWAALTTAAAFFMLNASSLPGLSQLGNLVGFGVVIGAFVMYFFYAPLIARLKWRPAVPSAVASRFWSPGAMRGGAWITGILVIVLIGALIAAGGPKIDETTRALRPRHSPANEALDRLSERLSDQNNLLWVLVTGKDEAQVRERFHKIDQTLRETGGRESHYTSPEILWPDAANQKANLPVLQSLAGESDRLRAAIEQAGFSEEAFALTKAVTEEWKGWKETPLWPSNESSEWLLRRVASRGPDQCVALGTDPPGSGSRRRSGKFSRRGRLRRELASAWCGIEAHRAEGVSLAGWHSRARHHCAARDRLSQSGRRGADVGVPAHRLPRPGRRHGPSRHGMEFLQHGRHPAPAGHGGGLSAAHDAGSARPDR